MTTPAPDLEQSWAEVVAGVKWAIAHDPHLAACAALLAHTERPALLAEAAPGPKFGLTALADHERCTAVEAITLAKLTRLPIDQFEKLRGFFRAEEFNPVVGDLINTGVYTPSQAVALIISVKPEVKIKRNQTDRLEEAGFGLPLFQGDIVSTYAQATATIICSCRGKI